MERGLHHFGFYSHLIEIGQDMSPVLKYFVRKLSNRYVYQI